MEANVTFDEAIASLNEDKKMLATGLHERALALGHTPFIQKIGKNEGNYKIEYKLDKKAYVLFISRISKSNLSLGCKFLHLNAYTKLINKLSETVRNELLASRPCKVDTGCTAYIQFSFEENEYFICRHAIRLKTPANNDMQSLWKLLESEALQRARAAV